MCREECDDDDVCEAKRMMTSQSKQKQREKPANLCVCVRVFVEEHKEITVVLILERIQRKKIKFVCVIPSKQEDWPI